MWGGDELTESFSGLEKIVADHGFTEEVDEDDLDEADTLDTRDLPLWFEAPPHCALEPR